MKFLLALMRNPFTLAGSLLLGLVVGKLAPGIVPLLDAVSQMYLDLLNLGAVPLIVVCVFLGLRRILSLPHASMRLGGLVVGGWVAEIGCARGDEPRHGVDELARLVQVELVLGVVGETALHGGGAERMHGDGVDDLHGWHVRDVARGRLGGTLLRAHRGQG